MSQSLALKANKLFNCKVVITRVPPTAGPGLMITLPGNVSYF